MDRPKMYSYVMKQDNNSSVLVRTCSRNASARTIVAIHVRRHFQGKPEQNLLQAMYYVQYHFLLYLAIARILSHKPSIGLCSVLFVIYIRVCFGQGHTGFNNEAEHNQKKLWSLLLFYDSDDSED